MPQEETMTYAVTNGFHSSLQRCPGACAQTDFFPYEAHAVCGGSYEGVWPSYEILGWPDNIILIGIFFVIGSYEGVLALI